MANSNIKKIPYNYSALLRCEPMAFKDSYFEKQPFVNGVKTAGRIIVAIDSEADEVMLPDEEYSMAACAVGVNLADVKHLVIHNPNSICVYRTKGVPKEVTFVTTPETHYNHIINVMHAAKPGDGYYVEKVNIIDKNGQFVEKDGVVYTSDMKTLIACSLSVTDLVIPEGVEEIISYAFANTRIKNVKFPDSLAILNENAFYKCRELQNVDFGSGLDTIKGFAFQECASLTHIKMPPQMKMIGRYKKTKNESAKEYLSDYQKRTAEAIAMELTEKDFVDFLRLDFINLGYDKGIVKRLQEQNWNIALAYMLEEGREENNDALVI